MGARKRDTIEIYLEFLIHTRNLRVVKRTDITTKVGCTHTRTKELIEIGKRKQHIEEVSENLYKITDLGIKGIQEIKDHLKAREELSRSLISDMILKKVA